MGPSRPAEDSRPWRVPPAALWRQVPSATRAEEASVGSVCVLLACFSFIHGPILSIRCTPVPISHHVPTGHTTIAQRLYFLYMAHALHSRRCTHCSCCAGVASAHTAYPLIATQ